MSVSDPIPEAVPVSLNELGNPNLKARHGQNRRWLLVISLTCFIGCILIYFINFRQAGAPSDPQQKLLQQRHLATANLAGPAAVSPEAEVERLREQLADTQQQLHTIMDQQAQPFLQNESLGQNKGIGPAFDDANDAYLYRMRDGGGSVSTAPAPQALGGATSIPPQSAASPFFDTKSYGSPPEASTAPVASPERPRRALRLVSAPQAPSAPQEPSSGVAGSASGAAEGETSAKVSLYDSADSVAPNSYVRAKVLVGVDMQTGIAATSDPKPVLFRIEGRAIGVGRSGRFQTSDLTGCLVNGAAFAELSSEKVYIKLQKITCPIDSHKTLVSKVEGYVTYKGKAGVRGRVVSREGSFASKALVAGTLQGLGQSMSTNVQRSQSTMTTGEGGTSLSTSPLSPSQIAQGMLGGGVGNASSMLADYYIKRAEQYQPVIEMPTGMDVELVFLDGFRFTLKGEAK